MTDETPSTALVDIRAQLRAQMTGMTDRLMPVASNKISTKGRLFTLPGGAQHPGPLNAIVLDFIQVNMFYRGGYNPASPQAPVCWSVGRNVRELAPSPRAPEAQSPACSGCPRDKWGSSATGKGKACKNQYRLVLVTPDADIDSDILSLYVSPSGMAAWSKYCRDLMQTYELDPLQVVTKVSFDPQAPYPTLLFALDAPHAKLETMWALRQRAQDILVKEPELRNDSTPAAA